VGGAVITGTVMGLSSSLLAADSGRGTNPGSVTVSVAGTNIASGLDSTGRFRLDGVPSGPITLEFTSPSFNASLTLNVTAGERIELTVRVTSSGVRIEAERREDGRDRTDVRGSITAVDATARTLRISGVLVEVPTTAVIRRGGQTLTFADLRVGDQVDVDARFDGTKIIATEVEVKRDDDDDDDDDDDRDDDDRDDDDNDDNEVRGVVSALGTTACPNITFNVGTVRVRANSSTRFEDGTCANVLNNVRVEVEGRRESDGTLLASKIELD
jgi:hypothetical protein